VIYAYCVYLIFGIAEKFIFFLMLVIIISPKFLNGTEKNWIREAFNILSGTKLCYFLKFFARSSMILLKVFP